MQKRFEENVAGVVGSGEDRELRAQMEKTARRKTCKTCAAAAKEELNSAVGRRFPSRSRWKQAGNARVRSAWKTCTRRESASERFLASL